MFQRDLVIGAITGYTWKDIKYWVNSLDRSGFNGIKAVVAYNVDYATCDELTKRGYKVLTFQKDDANGRVTYPNPNFNIVVDRFLHYYQMLDTQENRNGIRYVIATDVKDVIFQRNPSEYLDVPAIRCIDLVMSSEGIQYKNEAWGANNLRESFGPLMYHKHADNTIVNCGVLAGKFDVFLGLCKTIYLLCAHNRQFIPGGGGPDQAALNLLLNTPVYDHITSITTHEDPWAAQLGTTLDPTKINTYKPLLTERQPIWDWTENLMITPKGKPYTCVHQWDRVPEVRAAVERIYG
jgi:hypothetical protein